MGWGKVGLTGFGLLQFKVVSGVGLMDTLIDLDQGRIPVRRASWILVGTRLSALYFMASQGSREIWRVLMFVQPGSVSCMFLVAES